MECSSDTARACPQPDAWGWSVPPVLQDPVGFYRCEIRLYLWQDWMTALFTWTLADSKSIFITGVQLLRGGSYKVGTSMEWHNVAFLLISLFVCCKTHVQAQCPSKIWYLRIFKSSPISVATCLLGVEMLSMCCLVCYAKSLLSEFS